MNKIKNKINSLTMYQTIKYSLFALFAYSLVLSFVGIISYSLLDLVFSMLVLIISAYVFHSLFNWVLKYQSSFQTSLITVLIAFFIAEPGFNLESFLSLLSVSFFAIFSKNILTYKNRHIFNPVAFGLLSLAVFGFYTSFWWIGNIYFFIPVLFFGLLILKATHKMKMFLAFYFLVFGIYFLKNFDFSSFTIEIKTLTTFIFSFNTLFLGVYMLTEPRCVPEDTKK